MAAKKGRGLLTVYVDMPAELEDEFNLWYNEEHIPERLAVPGVLNAARYVAQQGGPKYLACYELDQPEVLFFRALEGPGQKSQRGYQAPVSQHCRQQFHSQPVPDDLPR